MSPDAGELAILIRVRRIDGARGILVPQRRSLRQSV
jgi:hypothetical protein